MAKRCKSKESLQVYKLLPSGENIFSNANLLCKDCFVKSKLYTEKGDMSSGFTHLTKHLVSVVANEQCQCTNDDCGTY